MLHVASCQCSINIRAEQELEHCHKRNLEDDNLSLLKVPGPIASDFSQTFGDFGIRRKLIFFSLLLVNFRAEKYIVWKILMKMLLVMVTIIKLTQ